MERGSSSCPKTVIEVVIENVSAIVVVLDAGRVAGE